jgi:hypothetical protein
MSIPPLASVARRATLVALAASLAACAHHGARNAAEAPPVQLKIENHAMTQMRIYLQTEGRRTRLGDVAGTTTELIAIPARLLGMTGELRLAAEPLAAFSRYVSDVVIVRPGQRVVLTLEHNLGTSSLAVRD